MLVWGLLQFLLYFVGLKLHVICPVVGVRSISTHNWNLFVVAVYFVDLVEHANWSRADVREEMLHTRKLTYRNLIVKLLVVWVMIAIIARVWWQKAVGNICWVKAANYGVLLALLGFWRRTAVFDELEASTRVGRMPEHRIMVICLLAVCWVCPIVATCHTFADAYTGLAVFFVIWVVIGSKFIGWYTHKFSRRELQLY